MNLSSYRNDSTKRLGGRSSTSTSIPLSGSNDIIVQYAGQRGAQGLQGIQGIQGSGAQGIGGIQGIIGTQGIQGITGIGTQGATGIQGITGYGLQGVAGTTGAQGVIGYSGNYIDYRFKRAASLPSTPTGNTPSGWYDTPPTADGNPLWMTKGNKTSAGALIGTWSTPIQLEGAGLEIEYSVNGTTGWHTTFTSGDLYAHQRLVGGEWSDAFRIVGEQGVQGTSGDNGDIGPSPVYRGEYDAGTDYYGSANRVDIVKYNDTFFVSKPNPPVSPFNGVTPVAGTYWSAFGATFDSIATGLLFAELAYIDNLGVRNFSGAAATAGSLSGDIYHLQENEAVVPDILEVALSAGSSGTCDITIGATMHSATWNASLVQTAIDFAAAYNTGGYAGVTVTNPTGSVLRFTKTTGLIGTLTATNNGITGSPSNGTHESTYAAGVAQIDKIILSGVGGSATISCNGASGIAYYSFATESGHYALTDTATEFVYNNYSNFYDNYDVQLSSTDNEITFTSLTPGTGFTPVLSISNIENTALGGISIRDNEIFEDKSASNNGALLINMRGYGGTTHYYRHIYIGDGRSGLLMHVDGYNGFIDITIPTSSSNPLSYGSHTGHLYYDSGTLKIS